MSRYQLVGLTTVVLFAALGLNASANTINGSFENGLTGWTSAGTVALTTAAFGSGPTDGTFQAIISNNSSQGPLPSDGFLEAFLGLPAGRLDAIAAANFPGAPDATHGSAIRQTFSITGGDTLTFDWNFLTNEPTPSIQNDFAFVTLFNISPGFPLADTFSFMVPSPTPAAEETGFTTTSFVVPVSGTYTLGFGVVDVTTTDVDSALLVDRVLTVPLPAAAWAGFALLGVMGGARTVRRARNK